MIDIVIYYPYLDGTTTSLIDTWYNLNHFTKVNCYIISDVTDVKKSVSFLMQLMKSVPYSFQYTVISLTEFYKKEYDSLILSFGIFRFVKELPKNYNNIFMLDAGRIFYDAVVDNNRYIDYLATLKNVTMYGNKSNQKYINNKIDYKIWYHKFSEERFNHLKTLQQENSKVTMQDRLCTGNLPFDNLKSDELTYCRWREEKGIYSENIGKLIFEFSALNKTVHYLPKHKTKDDGLTEYLSLFGIDDNKVQDIHITESQLFDKLGMKYNDVLLTDILRKKHE